MEDVKMEWIAECIRERLGLTLPITSEKLMKGIEKINGRCVPDETGILKGQDAEVFKVENNEEYAFEIVYSKKCSEEGRTFAIARELGKVLLNYDYYV